VLAGCVGYDLFNTAAWFILPRCTLHLMVEPHA
jgi:hypothetical protein